MKKAVLTILLLSLLLLLSAPQALALEIRITSSGNVDFYQDGVLGETSDQVGNAARPIKSLPATDNQKIKVSTVKDKVNVEVSETAPTMSEALRLTTSDRIESNRLRLLAPAAPTGETIRLGEPTTAASQQRQIIRQERQTRTEETIELRNRLDEAGQQRLELTSRAAAARLTQGAQFTVDPDTNQVTITTPAGTTHVLEHLPDQALEQMRKKGLFSDTIDSADISLGANAQGEVIYKTLGTRRKKAFGLFEREVPTEVELNDTTGEITESEVPSVSLFGQFLDVISF